MALRSLASHLLLLGCLLATAARADEPPPSAALEPIFNSRDLTGWKVPAEDYWHVIDGVLVGASDEAKQGSMLYSESVYGDVIVESEVRFSGEIDSGIMLRQPELQLQIGISRKLKRDMTCSFYTGGYPEDGQAKRTGELWKPDDWNRIRIEARGDTFTVWLNGQQVTRYTNAKYAQPGPVGLQIHAGVKMKVEFRNLRALPL